MRILRATLSKYSLFCMVAYISLVAQGGRKKGGRVALLTSFHPALPFLRSFLCAFVPSSAIVSLLPSFLSSLIFLPPSSCSFLHFMFLPSSLQKVDNVTVDPESTCPICMDNFNDNDKVVTQLECKHFYHLECIKPWLAEHNTCPTCRYVPVAFLFCPSSELLDCLYVLALWRLVGWK